ncbi:helix-turn-helix domain-containing protein [Haloferax sp. DFSO52]|uniref:helix-turn-helix domain-containing protein n=1 Tax=Haloferax sp. DFSO52 TaxID=3388505 RepID=UPI003A88E728
MTVGRGTASRPIYLEIRFEDPQLVLSSFTATHSAPVELEFQPTEGLGWDCAFVVVEGSNPEALLDALKSDPTVTDAAYLGSIGDDNRYRVHFESGVPLVPPSTTEMGVRVISVQHEDGAWNVQMHLPAHSTLHRVQSHYHDHDITFRVKRLHVARDTDVGAETMLLPGHREVLLVAYRNGYFNVPRKISQGELAKRLGISKSGVSQRIRRAVGRLVKATLSP